MQAEGESAANSRVFHDAFRPACVDAVCRPAKFIGVDFVPGEIAHAALQSRCRYTSLPHSLKHKLHPSPVHAQANNNFIFFCLGHSEQEILFYRLVLFV